jgi:cysteine desulfurase/selenocysteine lyase
MLNPGHIRSQFPILSREIHGRPLIYLDHAASSQKPTAVIEAQREYLMYLHANVHRGVHSLSQQATDAFEKARETVRVHVNAASTEEIIWTGGATDAINLVAQSWGRANVNAGDVILVTRMEHHANIVPWQILASEKGATLEVVDIHENGELMEDDFQKKLKLNPKIVAFPHVSNTLGTINDVDRWTREAQQVGAKVLVDGCQAVPHMKVNVQEIECDFYVFSGHKTYGPTGIGVLYGKKDVLNAMDPWRGGGEMIDTVSFEKGTTYAGLPHKFEAGTPHISGAIALGVALDWMCGVGLEVIAEHENMLGAQTRKLLAKVEGLRFIGTAENRTGVVSFVVDGIHPYDIGTLLDPMGIAVRTGHHCTQPLMDFYDVPGTVRASFGVYNTLEEVDALASGVERAVRMLR